VKRQEIRKSEECEILDAFGNPIILGELGEDFNQLENGDYRYGI
jgi:hypothetical protein